MDTQDPVASPATIITPPVKAEVITPPTNLRDKVSISANGVNPEMLEKAEQVIASLSPSYLTWVEDDLRRAQAVLEKIETCSGDDAKPLLAELFTIVHDIKGQGGSFNYVLMTVVGKYLCRFIEAVQDAPRPSHWPVLRVHVDSLRLIISERMEGDGGATGDRMLRGLAAAITKTIGQIDLN